MMIEGITLYTDRVSAVVVPPQVTAEARNIASIETDTEAVRPYHATAFEQHPNPFDRTLQEYYDMHGRMIDKQQASGAMLDRLT